ncbi:MAG TPA: choice-of-anchor tandem repeat GloVer-containing protein, partial [Candidatus Angelobacter sp.]|nr:choice-of-anchor tandem repeat GloVer-containing protein [Candidatus Angelobacter sp.]
MDKRYRPTEIAVMKGNVAALSLLLLFCVVTMASSAFAASSHYRVICTFQGGTDGSNPNALTADSSGNLYGTTDQGGTADAGTLFRLTPPVRHGGVWKKTILHSFASTDGSSPTTSPLIFDQAGDLYGTTRYGGSAVYGVVFEFMPPKKKGDQWTETVLY